MDPSTLRFSETHEWAHLEGDLCTVGITQFAVKLLTDIVFVELPEVGQTVSARNTLGRIESVKAVSDLYAPVGGVIAAVNEPLSRDTDPITKDPFGQGWLVKIRVAPGTTLDGLLTLEQYQKQIESDEG
jgi:glycine cleavage system H protein